jgi:peroxiredoxin Q/BCP
VTADEQGLEVGEVAPDFEAESSHGRTLASSAFRDKVAMVLFLLSDIESAGSLDELQGWNDLLPEFGRRRVQVLGVTPSSAKALMHLVADRDLSLTLLSDESGQLRRSYTPGAARGEGIATTVVDHRGHVVSFVARSSSRGHPDEVLESLDRLRLEHPDDMAAVLHLERSTDPDHVLVGDERMYTGEPVETEDGLRRPQQMAVGKDNVEGGGEFPDPNTPPRASAPGAAET